MNTVQKMSCAIAAALVCGHAAASTAEARISDIQLTIIDLRPNDGLVSAINFDGNQAMSGVYVNGPDGMFWNDLTPQFLAPLNAGTPVGASHGLATVSSSALTATADNGGQATWWAQAYSNVTQWGPGGLTLTPHSALHFTATGSLTVTRTNGDFLAESSLGASYSSDVGYGTVNQRLFTPYGNVDDMELSQYVPIDFLITNNTANPMRITLDLGVGARAAVVPEPGTVALLLGGLGVVMTPRLRRIAATRS